MKIVIKNLTDKPRVIDVPESLAVPMLNKYLSGKGMPPVTPSEMAQIIKAVKDVTPKGELFTLAEVKKADGSYIKIVM